MAQNTPTPTPPSDGAVLPSIIVLAVIALLVLVFTPKPQGQPIAVVEATPEAVAVTEASSSDTAQSTEGMDHLTLMMMGLEEVPLSSARAGQRLFGTSCATCHGQDAKGMPGNGKTLINSAFVNQMHDEEFVAFLLVGRSGSDPLNTTGAVMPAKGGNNGLTDSDLLSIVHYIRSLNGAKIIDDMAGVPTATPIPVREFTPLNLGGLGGGSSTSATATPAPTQAPTAEPTAVPANSDSSSSDSSSDLAQAKVDYEVRCGACHGSDGKGAPLVFNGDLSGSTMTDDEVFALLTVPVPFGSPQYPHPIRGGFPELNDEQVRAVIAYMNTLLNK